MKLMASSHHRRNSGEGLVLVIIVVAILAAGIWYLFSQRQASERQALAFARAVAERVVADDERFLDASLTPHAQVKYPPSWRARLFEKVRAKGKPVRPIEVTGDVQFTSYFFSPQGRFKAEYAYGDMPMYLYLDVMANGSLWQIEGMNLVWYPAPQ
jgi:hypothetical protein